MFCYEVVQQHWYGCGAAYIYIAASGRRHDIARNG